MTSSNPATDRPNPAEYSSAVADYVALVPPGDILEILSEQLEDVTQLLRQFGDEQALVRHPPYTWTIKQVVGHMIDCERIFGYRALRLARGDATPLPGFDENAYMERVNFDRAALADLLDEFGLVRRSNILMLGQLDADAWLRQGVVNNHSMTVRAIACVMAGHAQHHLIILHKRLGK
jgi:hypothetical protein